MNWFEIISLAGFLYLVVLIVTRIVVLRKQGILVSSGSDKFLKAKSVIYVVFFLVLLLWIFEMAKHAFQFQSSILPPVLNNSFLDSTTLKILGIVIIILALVLITVTIIHFGNSLRFGLNENNKKELITTGIFSISRNPFFLSLDLYFLGIAIVFFNLFFVLYAVLVIITIHFFILKEEIFLLDVHGEKYKTYSEKVGRYFSI